MKTTEVKDFQRAVQEVYAVGATLYVDTFGKLSVDGEIPKPLKKYVREHKEQFRQMLTGDPLQGLGWEARTALYEQALKYLDDIVESRGLDQGAAVEVLCRVSVADRLNEGWNHGDFERFRDALHEYIRVGLDAAKGKKRKVKVRG